MKSLSIVFGLMFLFTNTYCQTKKNTTNWKYTTHKDEFEETALTIASTKSVGTINLDFPYDGPQKPELIVRSDGEVLLLLRGQFMSEDYDNKSVRIKFDAEEPYHVFYSEPSDNSSGVIFLKNVYEKIFTAKKVMIKALVYGNGHQTMTFNVSGLNKSKVGNLLPKPIGPKSYTRIVYRIKIDFDQNAYEDNKRLNQTIPLVKGTELDCYGLENDNYVVKIDDKLVYVYYLNATIL